MSSLKQKSEDESSFDFKSVKIDIQGLPESYGLISFAESKKINYPKNYNEDEDNFDEGNPIASSLKEMVLVNKDQAKKLFVKYIKEQTSHNKRHAMEAKIYSMIHYNLFKYELESFSEARVISHIYKPFDGNDQIDDSSKGSIPDLWDIDNKQNELFKDFEKVIMIPHTEHIIDCPGCNCLGYIECSGCNGHGKMKSDQKTKCIRCSGNGKKICSYCRGSKGLKCYLELQSKFTNHKSEYILEDYGFPTGLLKTVTGELVLSQSLPKIAPLTDPNLAEINQNSKRIIDQHAIMYADERRLIQRHKLIAYSVTKCDYTWKRDFKGTFWIYGKENYIECSKYPQNCCCSIS